MTTMGDLKLKACHLLLDALVGADPDLETGTFDRGALLLALTRALEEQAVSARWEIQDGERHLHVDVAPLVYGALELLITLVHDLARLADVDNLDVITGLREHVEHLGPAPTT